MWGRLAVHGIGVRAQFARPLALVQEDTPRAVLEPLAALYGVPLVEERNLQSAAAEWGKPVPVDERPYSPTDLLLDCFDRVGIGVPGSSPAVRRAGSAVLLRLLEFLNGTSGGSPRPGESWASWWCRACDAAALRSTGSASAEQMAAFMALLPSGDSSIDTPRVLADRDPHGHDRPCARSTRETALESLPRLLERVAIGLEVEGACFEGRGPFLAQAAPLAVAAHRSTKAVIRPDDAHAVLALPAAKGWCSPDEQRLALQIALEDREGELFEISTPLVADLLPPQRLVSILAQSMSSRTITGALRRLEPAAARTVADRVLERTACLPLHTETLRMASPTAAREAIERCLRDESITALLWSEWVRELVPSQRLDEMLLAEAQHDSDPASRLSTLRGLSEDLAPDHIAQLLEDAAHAPTEAWIRMCRGLSRVSPTVLDRIDPNLLLEVGKRLSGHPEEAAEVLAAWPGAPLDLTIPVLRDPGPIGYWRRARLLRSHPDALEADDFPFPASDNTWHVDIATVEQMLALLIAASPGSALAEATRQLLANARERVDVLIAAAWRRRREGWEPLTDADTRQPEVLRLFLASVCYREAEAFDDPFNWRHAGLTRPTKAFPP